MVDYKEIGPIFPFLYQMQQNCILLSAFSASAQQKSILSPLKKQAISIYDCRSDAALCLIIVDKTSYPADRTPRSMPAAAGFPLQFVGA